MSIRTYHVGRSRIDVLFGDITASQAEVLVGSDSARLTMLGGGVSNAIADAAGPSVRADAAKMALGRAGDIVVTGAGRLPARYVFHAVTIPRRGSRLPGDAVVRQATRKAMQLLPLLGCRSIAFPAIGAGVAAIPYATVAAEMIGTLVDVLIEAEEEYHVEIYLKDRRGLMSEADFFMFFEEFAARTRALEMGSGAKGTVIAPPAVLSGEVKTPQARERRRRRDIYTMLRKLDTRRNEIESVLHETLSGEAADSARQLAELTAQLEEVRRLREIYQSELTLPTGQATIVPRSVFLSSTYEDLKPYRQAAREAIEQFRCPFIGMEEFLPSRTAPADFIRQKVDQAALYVGILGMRYGYVDEGTGFSMTELEYHQAIASEKPVCMFLMSESAPITPRMVERDPRAFQKLLQFRERVLQSHVCAFFTDPQDLAAKMDHALRNAFD
jgi:O-acetyl-ADP-ribose deacetylase (regulator of RNase III)